MSKNKLSFIFSVFIIGICALSFGFRAENVEAQARTLKDIGLTQNDVKHLTPAQIQDILDTANVDYSDDEQNIEAAAVAEPMLPNTVSCFNYYEFGSVQADFSASIKEAAAGTPIIFSGKITNNNDYPVVGGKLIVKIFKVNGNGEKNPNGPDVVDEFDAIKDMSIAANKSVPLSFEWKIPAYMDSGSYKAVAFFVAADKFNLLGLTFTDDIIGNSAAFSVAGMRGAVRFDKSKVSINDNKFYFAAYPPRVDTDEAKVKAELVNTTSVAQNVPVTWKVYSWDAQHQSNLVKEYTQNVRVEANSRTEVSYSITDKAHPVYYVRVEAGYQGTKSILGIRFIRPGVEKFRINFPAVTKFPLVKGEQAELFSCLHSVSDLPTFSEGRLVLTLKDKNGRTIHSHEYKGGVTGAMMGVASPFVPNKNYEKFSLKAELYQGDKLADSAVMEYDCKMIDPETCSEKSASVMTIALSVLAAVIVIGGAMALFRKKPEATIGVAILLFGFGLAFAPIAADARETQWNISSVPSLTTTFGGQITKLSGVNITVTYRAEIAKETGEVLSGGEILPIGTRLTLRFLPHSSDDIYWFGMGDVYDSPYGEWRAGATAPSVGCQDKDYTNVVLTGTPLDSGPRVRYLFFPLVIAPPTKSLTNLQNMTCGPLNANDTASCTVSGTGPIDATFAYGPTSGKFYYSYIPVYPTRVNGAIHIQPLSRLSATERAGCLMKEGSLGGYTLSVPEQTVSYSFSGTDVANNPPTTPTISGPDIGRPGETYTYGFTSTDPDLDKVKYGVNWANAETVNSWAPAPNADPEIAHAPQGVTQSLTKSWSTPGTYVIKAMAQDIKGAASGWATKTVVISETALPPDTNPPTVGCPPGATCSGSSCVAVPNVSNGNRLSAGQCAPGANLSDFGLNADRTGWSWKCQGSWQPVPETCSAVCQSGIYSSTLGICSNVPDDLCPNIPGSQTVPGVYDIDKNGRCVPKSGRIKSFLFNPNIAEELCPAYWEVEQPERSLGFNMRCRIGDDSVPLSNPLTGGSNTFRYPVRFQHALRCDISGKEDDVIVKRLEAFARCYRIGEIIEQ